MMTADEQERVRGWFHGRLPEEWHPAAAEVTVDREEITVRLALPDPEGTSADDPSAADEARQGRAAAFREESRGRRMAIAEEAQRRYGRTVSWGVVVGEDEAAHRELWTHLAVPVMTRLRQPQRQVLDTLVQAGVARSRADALAWCVRLVGQHEADWLAELRGAMAQVHEVRDRGPAA